MKVTKIESLSKVGCLNSYLIITDGEFNYKVYTKSESSIFIGRVSKKYDVCDYVKGLELHFSRRNPFKNSYISSASDVAKSAVEYIQKHPNKFEAAFLKNAGSAYSKKARYPRVSCNVFK